MLTSLADLALPYLQSYVPSHSGPVPAQLQTPDDPSNSRVSLFMGVPNQFSSEGVWTDDAVSPADGCLLLALSSGGHQD